MGAPLSFCAVCAPYHPALSTRLHPCGCGVPQTRVQRFRGWLRNRSERFIIVVGHSIFWNKFDRQGDDHMKNCEWRVRPHCLHGPLAAAAARTLHTPIHPCGVGVGRGERRSLTTTTVRTLQQESIYLPGWPAYMAHVLHGLKRKPLANHQPR